MIGFIKTNKDGLIERFDTQKTEYTDTEIDIDDDIVLSMKILFCRYQNGRVVFDEKLYNDELERQAHDKQIEDAKAKAALFNIYNSLNKLSDEQAYDCMILFPVWSGDRIKYAKNDRLVYNDKFYKVIQEHTSQSNWTPDVATSLYVEISNPNEQYPEFKKPLGAHDAYMKGDKVTFNGGHYESIVDYNVYSPEEYPNNWKKVG